MPSLPCKVSFVALDVHEKSLKKYMDFCLFQVTKPDGKPETLGLTVLDEPCAKQSDPTGTQQHSKQVQ